MQSYVSFDDLKDKTLAPADGSERVDFLAKVRERDVMIYMCVCVRQSRRNERKETEEFEKGKTEEYE